MGYVIGDQCAQGLRDPRTGFPIRTGAWWLSSSPEILEELKRVCPGNHTHGYPAGYTGSQQYGKQLALNIVKGFEKILRRKVPQGYSWSWKRLLRGGQVRHFGRPSPRDRGAVNMVAGCGGNTQATSPSTAVATPVFRSTWAFAVEAEGEDDETEEDAAVNAKLQLSPEGIRFNFPDGVPKADFPP